MCFSITLIISLFFFLSEDIIWSTRSCVCRCSTEFPTTHRAR